MKGATISIQVEFLNTLGRSFLVSSAKQPHLSTSSTNQAAIKMFASMAAPQPAIMLPKEVTDGSQALDHKPGARIHYNFVQSNQNHRPKTLIVFLNGLMTVQAVWLPIIAGIISKRKEAGASLPEMLAYDRYGQGLTEDRDPQDEGREPGHGHNVADAADDLYQLIRQISPEDEPNLILVGNSIGCAIARLYAQKHPVAAVLLLDSVLANSDFDIWPNPEKSDFDKNDLPEDVTIEVLKEQRAKFIGIFRPDVPNKEGLSRRDLPKLLPHSDGPKLKGIAHTPWVTVIGHGFDSFAEEGLKVEFYSLGFSATC